MILLFFCFNYIFDWISFEIRFRISVTKFWKLQVILEINQIMKKIEKFNENRDLLPF